MIRVYIFFADFFFICINKLSLFLKKSVNNTETSNTNSSSNTVTKKDSSYNSSGNNTLKRKNTFNYGSGGGDGDGEDGDKRKRKLTRYNKPRLAPAVIRIDHVEHLRDTLRSMLGVVEHVEGVLPNLPPDEQFAELAATGDVLRSRLMDLDHRCRLANFPLRGSYPLFS